MGPSASNALNAMSREVRKSATTRATVVLPTPPFSPWVRIRRGLSNSVALFSFFSEDVVVVMRLEFLDFGERMRSLGFCFGFVGRRAILKFSPGRWRQQRDHPHRGRHP